jgi:hypothetical protein
LKIGELLLAFMEMFCDADLEREEEKLREDQERARGRVMLVSYHFKIFLYLL